MSLSQPFIRRPIATVLLTIGIALAGIGAFFVLPVSPLPQVDYPAISVSANLPGGSPDTMATSVATPLERRLAVIAGVNEITSSSGNGSTRINLQFDLTRQIDSAARVQKRTARGCPAFFPLFTELPLTRHRAAAQALRARTRHAASLRRRGVESSDTAAYPR